VRLTSYAFSFSLVVPAWWGDKTFQSCSVSLLYYCDGFGGWRIHF
jgi:hypothetical protein